MRRSAGRAAGTRRRRRSPGATADRDHRNGEQPLHRAGDAPPARPVGRQAGSPDRPVEAVVEIAATTWRRAEPMRHGSGGRPTSSTTRLSAADRPPSPPGTAAAGRCGGVDVVVARARRPPGDRGQVRGDAGDRASAGKSDGSAASRRPATARRWACATASVTPSTPTAPAKARRAHQPRRPAQREADDTWPSRSSASQSMSASMRAISARRSATRAANSRRSASCPHRCGSTPPMTRTPSCLPVTWRRRRHEQRANRRRPGSPPGRRERPPGARAGACRSGSAPPW